MSAKPNPYYFEMQQENPAASDVITIPVAEYVALNRLATLLEIILHDHTVYHEAVGIVKNVLLDQMAQASNAQPDAEPEAGGDL